MIEITNFTKYYGDFKAVDNITFTVDKGEVLGLLGPNGAGKTTTLRTLCCYLKANEGTIIVNGESVAENPDKIKSFIGYLPESAPIYSEMMVYDYLDYIANIHQIPEEKVPSRIREIAKMCGLNQVMHKNVSELSKGYKQRVGLAHAMINDPDILILDEPTSGLDPNQIIEIRSLIKEIAKEKTIIVSSHILSEVEATCDRVVIINNGKIAADDKTQNLKNQKSDERVINIELTGTSFDEAKQSLHTVAGVGNIQEIGGMHNSVGLLITCSGAEDIRHTLYDVIKSHNWGLLTFKQESKTLENIFRELTQEQS
jgi:ABC-2 type transport system ATP-binding protein